MGRSDLFVDIFFRRGIKRGGKGDIGEIQGRKRQGRFERAEVGGKSWEVLVLLKESKSKNQGACLLSIIKLQQILCIIIGFEYGEIIRILSHIITKIQVNQC